MAPAPVRAALEDRDSTFGGTGKNCLGLAGGIDVYNAIARQPYCKVLAGGSGSDGSNEVSHLVRSNTKPERTLSRTNS